MGYCQTIYDGETAIGTLTADTSSLYNASSATGCGASGFPHSTVTAYSMPIAGTHTSANGGTLAISDSLWRSVESWGTSEFSIVAYGADWALAQNAATNGYYPGLWSMFMFHTTSTGFGYCQVVYKGVTAVSTLTTDTSSMYNASDATGGCGASGFPHSTVTTSGR